MFNYNTFTLLGCIKEFARLFTSVREYIICGAVLTCLKNLRKEEYNIIQHTLVDLTMNTGKRRSSESVFNIIKKRGGGAGILDYLL